MRKSLEKLGIVGSALVLAACSSAVSAEPADAPAVPAVVESVSWDYHGAAAQALDSLRIFVESTATTTTVPRRITQAVMPGADKWDQLAQCESGGDWATNTGNGFGGGLQFAHGSGWSTWRSFGGLEFAADPWDATREQQIVIAERVLARSGWRAWPGCSDRLGFE